MKKVVCMVLAAVMLMACLAGCGSTPASTPASTPEDSASAAFKIGGTAPLTGGAAIYGNAVKNAAQIAVDEINAKGAASSLSCATKTTRTTPKRPSTRTTR